MAEQFAIAFLILMFVVGSFTLALIVLSRYGRAISAWMDRHDIRPSVIEGVVEIWCGSVMFVSALVLPTRSTYLLGALYSVIAAVIVAFGIEKLRVAPTVELPRSRSTRQTTSVAGCRQRTGSELESDPKKRAWIE